MYYGDTWANVPDGSTFEVTLKGHESTGVAGTLTVTRPAAAPMQGPLSATDFPLSIPVGTGEQIRVKFDVFFAGAPADVEVVGRVVKADGSVYEQPSPGRGKLTEKAKVFTVKFFVLGGQ